MRRPSGIMIRRARSCHSPHSIVLSLHFRHNVLSSSSNRTTTLFQAKLGDRNECAKNADLCSEHLAHEMKQFYWRSHNGKSSFEKHKNMQSYNKEITLPREL